MFVNATLRCVFSGLWLAFLPVSAMAQCFICDRVVEFTPKTAKCFLMNAEEFRRAAQTDPAKRTEVNLKDCGGPRGLDAFPNLDSLADARQTTPRVTYLLDLDAIECVNQRLRIARQMSDLRIELDTECE